MYIGLLTVSLGSIPLKEKAKWASEQGFKSLEIACWPASNSRDYSSCDIDVDNFTQKEAEEIKEYFREYGLTISSLAYYDNNLDHDINKRNKINNHFKKCVDAAVLLGVPAVGTFIGRDIDKTIEENLDEFQVVFSDLVKYAEDRGIKVIIENCAMPGWQIKGIPGTISYSPELWREIFKRVPNKNFGLNYDPSHLHSMLMDYISPIKEFKDRIFHTHAKDAEVFEDRLKAYGVYNKQLNFSFEDSGYWRYRMPGLGQIDWKNFVNELREIGYDDVISIEHEDPLYEGSEEKVKKGLSLGIEYLKKLV
ncbi:sugar phosphate isomerase/epimerase [Clostridium pasteurianum DSM 525 = ATCC 6013]|uniref:Sugar phosphate isomerase/epimerase n=3 Tax=Clostridium pasteurianum TaxID=1501 RepID=A0A0H3JA50_CLOPA|nr:sugar phosphate isomerase/epimerase [Clostridium pasteurianum]AJA49243.1 sugar phosphate isomerase/epimerase [Clostridium pasteurianum DSM 525 = ATCC 6013]AJA53231.1 sugar phosphate isomerase/epimerase [Clostridium pasteurianum DSM 525 = ATCC 6013]AOZ76422.1 sugar phosphate isomerase [Clostridium pasteurianum DSM 525 = ATCC 6013]AOZ80219.1 sugar phosphate isomerase [Clostridium pasteurianum]ELP58262.1 xylose isomerase domain-containing protein [Clostridium pasteurianum DSM 525 = ATCC 6013]